MHRKESLLKQLLPFLGMEGGKRQMNEPSLELWKEPELEMERSQSNIINRFLNPFSVLFSSPIKWSNHAIYLTV